MSRKVTYTVGMEGGPTRDITVDVHDLDVDPWGAGAKLRVVGTDVPRVDAALKATGAAKYTYDIQRPNMAYCALVRSPHAHAKVVGYDTSAAEKMRGVLAVEGLVKSGYRVTFAGKGIVAVCAETEEILGDALHAITVEYEASPGPVTTEDGMADGAAQVDPNRGNVSGGGRRGRIERGDAKEAMSKAATRVSATFRTQVQTHSALETHGSVIEPNGDGTYTVWASTQGTGPVRGSVAQLLGIGAGKVRVITEHMGGGFGAKLGGIDEWDRAAVQFARDLKRPVKAMLDRRAEHLVAGCRPDSIQELSMACDDKGKITALVGKTWGTAGNGRGGAGAANTRVYSIPNIDMQQSTVATFTGRARAFRAPGHPQGLFALDGIVDELALAAGMDPLELRLRNDPHPLRQVQWRLGAERMEWERKRREYPGDGTVKRGVGCAAATWFQKGRGAFVVNLELQKDGSVTVMNAVQDIGTGTRTVLAVLVAEELGIAPERVTVRIGDTLHPPGPSSGGSTTAPSIGPAAREAGYRAQRRLAELLAEDWGCQADEIELEGVAYKGPGGKSASFDEACGLIGKDGLAVSGQRRPNYAGFHGETAGCQFVEVAVDTETGVIRVERVVAVHDAGRIIDTLTARSQVVGGVIQGLSYALHEDRQMDRNLGDMVNPTFDTYRILGIGDCPPIDCLLTSLDSGHNNAGMMGLGEPVTVPTAGAVANAVSHALGVRMSEIPITPARVLAALGGAR
jgi:xanthine dehydrogenase YagR molybdenum-binding subunit